MLTMIDPKAHLPSRRSIGSELVCDHDAGRRNGDFQEFRHEPARSLAVSSTLEEDIKNEAILIDRAPKPVGLARDRDGDLIQMPFVATLWSPLTDLAGERLPEF